MTDAQLDLNLLTTVFMAVIGALMGSAFLCAAERWAAGEDWVTGRSRCTSCNKTLGALDLIPIVSFVAHGGKCAHCGSKIPSMCLWAEVAGAFFLGLLGWRFGFTPMLGMWGVFALVLMALSFTDIANRIIPNKLLLVAVVNRVVWFFVLGQPVEATLITAGVSLGVPVFLLVLVLVFEKVRGTEAMGGGDIKLLVVMALYLNWVELLVTLVVACILGLVAAKAKWGKTIAFGPALASACILAVTLLHPVVTWYSAFFGM